MPQFVGNNQKSNKISYYWGLGDLNQWSYFPVQFQLLIAQIEQVSTYIVNENFTDSGPLAAQ